jgi:cytochrome c oxidase subunit 4
MDAHAHAHPHAHHAPGEEDHPRAGTYTRIAVTLVILTALEVAVYYVESIRAYLVPILIVLMIIKFALVAMYYMHLKQDSRLFSGLFVFPIIIAVIIIIALIALFKVPHPTLPAGP